MISHLTLSLSLSHTHTHSDFCYSPEGPNPPRCVKTCADFDPTKQPPGCVDYWYETKGYVQASSLTAATTAICFFSFLFFSFHFISFQLCKVTVCRCGLVFFFFFWFSLIVWFGPGGGGHRYRLIPGDKCDRAKSTVPGLEPIRHECKAIDEPSDSGDGNGHGSSKLSGGAIFGKKNNTNQPTAHFLTFYTHTYKN